MLWVISDQEFGVQENDHHVEIRREEKTKSKKGVDLRRNSSALAF